MSHTQSAHTTMNDKYILRRYLQTVSSDSKCNEKKQPPDNLLRPHKQHQNYTTLAAYTTYKSLHI